ncbi:MAG: 16S rRNA (cytidine(1402)-2'-O)-methyltransferase [Patescibacteria group bacterium]|jgi:16S rRNA (cytidine1402-2'-O)-methyltransferase
MDTGKLYIVSTPIGNLGDMTLRAIEALKVVDIILCEDTRVSQKLLDHYQVKGQTISYHHHSDERKVKEIQNLLNEGKNVALVTDAGTPGISDPGNMLISILVKRIPGIVIIPIPGVSAVTTALSISGFPTDKFIFLGFPPHKNKRLKYFSDLAKEERTVIFFESGHRIIKCLQDLKNVLDSKKQIVVCRELTKKFESVYRGTIDEIIASKIDERGEFVIVIN